MGDGKMEESRSAREMHGLFPHLYEKFSREQWAKLRANMPLEISDEDLDALGEGEPPDQFLDLVHGGFGRLTPASS